MQYPLQEPRWTPAEEAAVRQVVELELSGGPKARCPVDGWPLHFDTPVEMPVIVRDVIVACTRPECGCGTTLVDIKARNAAPNAG